MAPCVMDLGATENPDWGYARSKQVLLKTQLAEFSSSAFSTSIELEDRTFYGGNRDYSWQGLIVGPLQGKLYKMLDGLYCSPNLPLVAMGVSYQPNSVTYIYRDEDGEAFKVEIRLQMTSRNVILAASASRSCWFAPILDFTAGDEWAEDGYQTRLLEHGFLVKGSAVPLRLLMKGFDECRSLDTTLQWDHKLGDGFRQKKDGTLSFINHRRHVYVPAIMHASSGSLKVEIPVLSYGVRSFRNAPLDLPDFGSGPVAKALELRLRTLSTYGLTADSSWFPEAGAWWFRRPWLRDCLEGLRSNIKTYLNIFDWSDRINSLVRTLMKTIPSRKGLPVILADGYGFSSDAPPQLLNVSCDLAKLSGNRDLMGDVVDLARWISGSLLGGRAISGSVLNDSIICSPAASSWLDSVIGRRGGRWPTRLPHSWQDTDPLASEFGLVEVNALYVEALSKISRVCENQGMRIPTEVQELLSILGAGFAKGFKEDGALPSLTFVPSAGLRDNTPGSPALVALATLGGTIYDTRELHQLWPIIVERLLVHRRLVELGGGTFPFGVIVRDLTREPYLGDAQYHATTIWPRDTPYLIGLMEVLGQDIKGLLLNNLDHMIAEGAFGYCSELFSLPIGENPSPSPESDNPVPVKNPAQYWSHWCDPYLDHLDILGMKAMESTAI